MVWIDLNLIDPKNININKPGCKGVQTTHLLNNIFKIFLIFVFILFFMFIIIHLSFGINILDYLLLNGLLLNF